MGMILAAVSEWACVAGLVSVAAIWAAASPARAEGPEATYTNPVGDGITMGDPFAVLYGRTYYLTGTTRGFGIWSSPDLVHWTSLGPGHVRDERSWGRESFWAPELFEHDGRYYMVYSASRPKTEDGAQGPGFRICLAAAEGPAGPYRDLHAPWCDPGYPCIDGHVFFDEDGAGYLYFAKVGVVREPEFKLLGSIYGVKLRDDLSGPAGEPALCVQA